MSAPAASSPGLRGAFDPRLRPALLAGTGLGTALLCYSLAGSPAPLSALWGGPLAVAALILVGHATHPDRRFLTPVFFALFFVLGFVVSFASLVADPSAVPRTGFGALGRFDFTDDAMIWPIEVMSVGVAGILAATFVGERVLLPLFGPTPVRDPRVSAATIAGGWFAIAVAAISACGVFGLGRTGLNGADSGLPAGVGGFIVYVRDFMVPPVAAVALFAAVRQRRLRLAVVLVAVAIGLAIVDSFIALSRGRIATVLVPALVVALQRSDASRSFQRAVAPVALGLLIASGPVLGAVNGLRDHAYSSRGQADVSDTISALREGSPDADREAKSGVQVLAGLITGRVGGIHQLLAVSGCRSRGFGPAWGLVEGDTSWTDQVIMESYGFLPVTNRSLAFGVNFGFWGPVSLVDSLPLVFLWTVVLVLFPILVEIVFSRFGDKAAGQVLAILIVNVLWGQPQTFQLVRLVFVAGVLLLLCKWMLRAGPDAPAEVAPARGRSVVA